jgi:hypothetical protein
MQNVFHNARFGSRIHLYPLSQRGTEINQSPIKVLSFGEDLGEV